MPAYEIRFYRTDRAFSVLCFAAFASGRDAKSSMSLLLRDDLPLAVISHDERHVDDILFANILRSERGPSAA